jgi:hypothetical protein
MKFEEKIALGLFIFIIIVAIIIFGVKNNKNKKSTIYSMPSSLSTDPVIDNKPITIYPLGLPPNFNGGIYTISGKEGYYGNDPNDYKDYKVFTDTRINDTTDPRWTGLGKYSLAFNPAINAIDYTTDMTKTMPMTFAWVFLNPTAANYIDPNTKKPFTIPLFIKTTDPNLNPYIQHFNYTIALDNETQLPDDIQLSPVTDPKLINPAFVRYNSAISGLITPVLEKKLDMVSFMMMFHMWILKTQNFDSIKNTLFYNSIVGNKIYDIIDNPKRDIANDSIRIDDHVWGQTKYTTYNTTISRSTVNLLDDIKAAARTGNTITFWQKPGGNEDYDSKDFYIYNSTIYPVVSADTTFFTLPYPPSSLTPNGATSPTANFYLKYNAYHALTDGEVYSTGDTPIPYTVPFYNDKTTNLITNSFTKSFVNIAAPTGALFASDTLFVLDNSENINQTRWGLPIEKQYWLWINPYVDDIETANLVRQFIQQDPYLQFLFFAGSSQLNSSDSYPNNIFLRTQIDPDLLTFVNGLYPTPQDSPTNNYMVNWVKKELCSNNSGFLYEKTGNYCACQTGFHYANQNEIDFAKIQNQVSWQIHNAPDDLRCLYAKCQDVTALQLDSDFPATPACTPFCGVINIENSAPGSIITNNGTYNISCSDGSTPQNFPLICGDLCTKTGGKCTDITYCKSGDPCPTITCENCPTGTINAKTDNGEFYCKPTDPTASKYDCDTSTKACYLSGATGTYDSLNSCNSSCSGTGPSTTKYACDNTTKTCSASASGAYDSIDSCNSSCSGTGPSNTNYACDSTGKCVSESGGPYTSSDCDNKCVIQPATPPSTTFPTWAYVAIGFSILFIIALITYAIYLYKNRNT